MGPIRGFMTINYNSISNHFNILKMKKIKLNKGLSFNKEAISKLNDDQLSQVKGGGIFGGGSSKGDSCSCCHHSCNSKVGQAGQP